METLEQKKNNLKNQLRFAINILRRLPEGDSLGYRSFWPLIRHSIKEKMAMEPAPIWVYPTAAEIELMDCILNYYKPLDAFETKLVWRRAEGTPWKVLCRDMNYRRTSLICRYNEAISKMLLYISLEKKT